MTSNKYRSTGKVANITRLPSSVNGNPRYSFTVDGVLMQTAPDCSYGYAITNFEGQRVTADWRSYYGKATLIKMDWVQK